MSVAISAVSAVSNDGQAVPVAVEKALTEFVAQMQDGGMAHVANPAALAAELVGNLRTYFDHAQRFDGIVRDVNKDGAADRVSSLPTTEVALHGGPARARLEPPISDSKVSPEIGSDFTQLRRVMDMALASMNFATETALVVRGTSQISHSVNTLLKGQ